MHISTPIKMIEIIFDATFNWLHKQQMNEMFSYLCDVI